MHHVWCRTPVNADRREDLAGSGILLRKVDGYADAARIDSPDRHAERERAGSEGECVIELRASRNHLSVSSSPTRSSSQRRRAIPCHAVVRLARRGGRG